MTMSITSLQNPRIKRAVRLRERRGREQQQRIVIDGIREVTAALRSKTPLDELFFLQSAALRGGELQALAEQAGAEQAGSEQALAEQAGAEQAGIEQAGIEQAGIEIFLVDEPVFAKLAFGSRGDGVVATAPTPAVRLNELTLPDDALVVVLEAVEKPGNLGAVIRSCDAAGASALIAADPRTDLFNPNAIRASLGAIFHVPVAAASTTDVLAFLRQRELQIFAARVDADRLYAEVDFRAASALVLGSEAEGLSDAWRAADVQPIVLPMRGVLDSLNVATTAGVLLFEAVRQRSQAPS